MQLHIYEVDTSLFHKMIEVHHTDCLLDAQESRSSLALYLVFVSQVQYQQETRKITNIQTWHV